MPATASTTDPRPVTVRSVTKRFGANLALADINLTVAPGRITALVGANGAGKSTLLGVIAGRVTPTEGDVLIGDRVLPAGSPREIGNLGVATIYQELTIVPGMSALENVMLGPRGRREGLLRGRRQALADYRRVSDRLGADIPADVPAGELSVASQQLLEIMRCVRRDADVLLLDEPTSALDQGERDNLFRIMRELRDEGRTLVFVSHDLDEVLQIADDVTVFRNGRLIETRPSEQWTKADLIARMLGDAYAAVQAPPASSPAARAAGTAFEVADLRVRPGATPTSFSIRAGEVLGLAGLAGSGRSSLLRALSGDSSLATGTLVVDGVSAPVPTTVRAARALGIALIPEDRKRSGLVMGMTARENINLPSYAGMRGQSLRQGTAAARAAAARVGFPAEWLDRPAGALSGGNQQKLLLARWADSDSRVLLADEPTRGVDVGAKVSILNTLRELADRGLAVLFASSELEDLEEICDRVLVLRHGVCHDTLTRDRGEISVDRMLSLSFD